MLIFCSLSVCFYNFFKLFLTNFGKNFNFQKKICLYIMKGGVQMIDTSLNNIKKNIKVNMALDNNVDRSNWLVLSKLYI